MTVSGLTPWPSGEGPVEIWRDGEHKAGPMGRNEAFHWLLSHQGQSVYWACTYEGWEVRVARAEPPTAGDWPSYTPWEGA